MTDEPEPLKPCPVCGGEMAEFAAVVADSILIGCTRECGARWQVPQQGYREYWNKTAADILKIIEVNHL